MNKDLPANTTLPAYEPASRMRTASVEQLPGMLWHLKRLTGSFSCDGRQIAYLHVYAQPASPDPEAQLRFITARESGFEGIACVDDVARAAILALQTFQQTGAVAARRLALDWLGFLEYMQEPDGRFTNFICDATGRKNRLGVTSVSGGEWWTARALWALATAWRLTGDDRYLARFEYCDMAAATRIKVQGIQTLALLEIYKCQPDPALREAICARCDAIVASGPRYFRDLPQEEAVASLDYS